MARHHEGHGNSSLRRLFVCAICLSVAASEAAFNSPLSPSFEVDEYCADDVIVRDIAIVGGGASGTYAAVRLQQDFHKSVVVVERKANLGGHTETYHVPGSTATIDVGVIAFHDLPITRAFFARFDIPLTKLSFNLGNLTSLDFRNGHHVSIPVGQDARVNALNRYATYLERYPTLAEGFVFPLPVPRELVLPFGQFAEEFNYTALITSVWQISQGYGDLLSLPTLYVLKAFGPEILRSLKEGFLTTLRQNNHELYGKAFQSLGGDRNVLLESSVIAMDRDPSGAFAHAVVSTPYGYKLLRVKRFLFTLPPKLDNVIGFDLDDQEIAHFSQFKSNNYCTGLLQNASLAADSVLSNMVVDPSTFHLPRLPSSYNLGPMHPSSDLTNVKFCSNVTMSYQQIQGQIIAEAAKAVPRSTPELAFLASHGPFGLHVSAESIANGFYQSLYKLQGKRRSYWTGAAWHTHDSSLLWNFTERILQRMQQEIR